MAFVYQRVDIFFPKVFGVIAGDAANVNRSPLPFRGVCGVTKDMSILTFLGVRGATKDGSKNAAAADTLKTGYGLSSYT